MTSTAQNASIPSIVLGAAFLFGASFALQSAPAAAGGPAVTPMPAVGEPAPPPIDMTSAWPCVQRKVDTLSVAQIWDGPPIDDVKGWFLDTDVSALIEVLSSRRIPVDQAEGAVEAFAKEQPDDKKDERLTLLFAGLFDRATTQRRGVMAGIERYQRSQQERSRELERQSSAISTLQDKASTDDDAAAKLKDAQEKFDWAQRIFHERQTNIPLACELPVLIEERLFMLTRAIRNGMSS
ncbi:hypothetical protein W911_13270 [Hyphomicrobium nitrativorans NL23]|uniref:Secreted protein n=1 Tax=Hyphomicrobium nitrativorans NL23 TaxID=1029756 RepID=V5SGJ5_9HYPH|nr:hypothetical protein [Hyphomicrobium nitrativorans]AHB49160.1 hypothetical protein W911_13270 [Hyphomicrobium nitrativorans NL23]